MSALLRVLFVLLPAVLFSSVYAQGEARLFQAASHPQYVPGEVLIKLKSELSSSAAASVLQAYGVQRLKTYGPLNILKCSYPAATDMQNMITQLKEDENIVYAEPNYIYHIVETIPNDPRFSSQWALNNTGQTGGSNDADIDAPEAWQIQTGSRSVIVGIIDTGIDYNHPDLAANVWQNPGESGNGRETNGVDDDGNGFVDDFRGWDFINNDNNPFDDNSHGTHVAGIIGAVGNNGAGVSGSNWQVSLVGLKFLAANGSGNTADAIEAILYGIQMGFPILSNSWGGGGFSQALADAIESANQAGILFVAAAGNESNNTDNTPNYPSNYASENVVSVASSDDRDQLSSFSNFGATTVDLAAPGSDILSTVPGSGYQEFSGTSMATPYVSGVAALLRAQFPGIDHLSLKYRLMGSTDPKSAFAGKTVSGGRLNAAAALSTNPLITTLRHPDTNDAANAYPITAFIVDDGTVAGATLHYTLSGSATGSDSVAMTAANLQFSANIPAQPLETTINYFVRATDNDGNATTGQTLSFRVTANPPGGGCCGAGAVTLHSGNSSFDAWGTLLINALLFLAIPVYYLRKTRRNHPAE